MVEPGWLHQIKLSSNNICSSTFRKKPLLFSIPPLCQGTQKLPINYKRFFPRKNIPKLMSESAVVQFPKCVAEDILHWPSVADILIRWIIQVGSLGPQNVLFGLVEGFIEYFILSCL